MLLILITVHVNIHLNDFVDKSIKCFLEEIIMIFITVTANHIAQVLMKTNMAYMYYLPDNISLYMLRLLNFKKHC